MEKELVGLEKGKRLRIWQNLSYQNSTSTGFTTALMPLLECPGTMLECPDTMGNKDQNGLNKGTIGNKDKNGLNKANG